MTASLIPDLKAVARTSHHVAIYIGNGHAIWEASLANVISRGDRVLVPATGRFGHGWATVAEGLGGVPEILDFGKRSPYDLARIEERLAADTGHEIKAVLAVHTDTSTSVRNDIAGLRDVLDRLDHPALLMADCMASMGCDPFEMDAWGADVVIAGSQKGLMTPPGLGFVWFNDRADAARATANCVTGYWDWRPRANPEEFSQRFYGTAPTHHLYGLRVALTMLLQEEGLEAAWARHAKLASALWAAADVWGQGGPLEMKVADAAHRSHAVTALRLGAPHGTALRDWLSDRFGVTLGIGLGMAPPGDPAWHGFFRVGHMGHVSGHMMMGTLGAIEAGLKALQIPHGKGGLETAADVLAGA
jgi:alanine-glyoxylate transaminase/serine-glyoxylate transaminase/serine-pyruvate transaminase